MESLWWAMKTWDPFSLSWPILKQLLTLFVLSQGDFIVLLVLWYGRRLRPEHGQRASQTTLPSGLVIIPALLRNSEDFKAITHTVESCATNGYPDELSIIASVDGCNEEPALYRELVEWAERRSFPSGVRVHIAGTPQRQGKMMAVESGVDAMKRLVAEGAYASFPPIYFSVDGDGTLGPRALELIARRLLLPHRISGNPRRLVAGKIFIRADLFWKGLTLESLRHLLTVRGQIYLQVAREFLFANVSRFNLKLVPKIGVGGALYCCWSDILLNGPTFMGHMRTLRRVDWIRWWLGFGAPTFSQTTAEPLPEALTGPSDDTAVSFIAAIASWKDGRLSFDPPRTPLHALGRLAKAYLWERSPDYEPEARVYTYTPATLKTLWVQRVRWNASWIECGSRFRRALGYHWEVGGVVAFQAWVVLWTLAQALVFYVLLPLSLLTSVDASRAFAISYLVQVAISSLLTFLSLAIEKEWRKYWPVVFALPLAPLYSICINLFTSVTGAMKDLLLFGNSTTFAPEDTFKKGRTERLALLFRLRRFLSLCVRAVVVGDVPWGAFWFGWTETPWTPSGYAGWTTGKKPPPIVPSVSNWFGADRQ